MSITDFLYFTGIAASCMFLGGSGHQLFKMLKTKQTIALSWHLAFWVAAAMSLYVFFGFAINEPVIYIGNLIGVSIYILILATKWRLERK